MGNHLDGVSINESSGGGHIALEAALAIEAGAYIEGLHAMIFP